MNNIMEINGHKAAISFDPQLNMFRGEFIDLAGGADFYADSTLGLKQEGEISLRIYLDICREKGINPQKTFSGRLNLRLDPQTHKAAATAAGAAHESLNSWAAKIIQNAVRG